MEISSRSALLMSVIEGYIEMMIDCNLFRLLAPLVTAGERQWASLQNTDECRSILKASAWGNDSAYQPVIL
jgi:hypothetical protein